MIGDDAPMDANTLDRLAEDLGPDRANELLGAFVAESERRMARIAAAAAARRPEDLHTECHALKGSAASYGALAVAREADRMAAACRSGDAEAAFGRVAALRDLVSTAVAACRARISDKGGSRPG